MNKRALTVKQKELLDFIDSYQKEHKVPPTFLEMSQKYRITIGAIQHRLNSLTRKKVLFKENMYKISAPTVPSAPVARVEEQLQSGVGMERPLL